MCGLIAVYNKAYSKSVAIKVSNSDLSLLNHRGPDIHSLFHLDDVSFGHCRLSIVDLDSRSTQPFTFETYTIVFNGEIYNYEYLKQKLILKGYIFSTSSDTEVLLFSFLEWGENCLDRLRGMFSFVIWNSLDNSFFIARDAFGIKPLYYFLSDDVLILSSTFKSLSSILSRRNYFIHTSNYSTFFDILGHIPDFITPLDDINVFPAGCFSYFSNTKSLVFSRWASLPYLLSSAVKTSFISPVDALSSAKKLFSDSIAAHLTGDSVAAVLLSSGLDSSVIAHLGSNCSNLQYSITVSYDFDSSSYFDENTFASSNSAYLNLSHINKVVSQDEFLNDLPIILDLMDQPTIDGINIWFASKAAKNNGIKVVLSGVGADELLVGYNLHFRFKLITILLNFIDFIKIRSFLQFFIKKLPNLLIKFLPFKVLLIPFISNNPFSIWLLLRSDISTLCDLSLYLNSHRNISSELMKSFDQFIPSDASTNYIQLETEFYLKNQLLRDADWASMSHGVELRTPFVDLNLWEGMLKLKPSLDVFSKKQLLSSFLPKDLSSRLLNRPKTGFFFPTNSWIKDKAINWKTFIQHSWKP